MDIRIMDPERDPLIGTRHRLLKPDMNEVERGEVVVPVGHSCKVTAFYPDCGMYAVAFDDDTEGRDMGWCFYTADEIRTDLEPKDKPE